MKRVLQELGGKSPFGGYKQSGNGRAYGVFGFDDFTEIKGVVGFGATG